MHSRCGTSAAPRTGVTCVFALVLTGAVWFPAAPVRAVGPTVVESKLACGARLFVSEQRNLPIVVIRILVDAGGRLDPKDQEGLANLTAVLLTEGTKTRSATEISETIDFLGGSLSSWAETDYAAVALRVLSKDIDVGTDLLADVLLHPAFSGPDLERRRETIVAGIRNARDNPTQVAQKAFRRAVFEGEPYGHPVDGTEDSVRRITRAEVKSFYERNYGSARALIVVVGDVSSAEVEHLLDHKLAAWKQGGERTFVYPPAPRAQARTLRVDKRVTQAAIILGHDGVARDNPDIEALSVMNYILGSGGFSSRLTESIRMQAGLAYSVGSSFAMYKSRGSFQIVMQTKNRSVGEAVARAKKELERIRNEPVADQELDEARRYLTGSFPLSLDTLGEVADFISAVAFYNLGWDYADRYLERVRAVTREDVQRVARQYLHPDALLEVVVADLDQIGEGNGEGQGR
jgi:zinc protease